MTTKTLDRCDYCDDDGCDFALADSFGIVAVYHKSCVEQRMVMPNGEREYRGALNTFKLGKPWKPA